MREGVPPHAPTFDGFVTGFTTTAAPALRLHQAGAGEGAFPPVTGQSLGGAGERG